MADSKQLRILKKLTAHLLDTPGFAPLKVVRGLAVISAKDAADNEAVLSILEAPRPIIGDPAGNQGLNRNERWTLLVQGWPVDDKKNPSDPAYEMKAAVEQQLAKIVVEDGANGTMRSDPLYLLGKDIGSMIIGQGVVRPPEGGASRLAMFFLPLILEVSTDVSNPYK